MKQTFTIDGKELNKMDKPQGGMWAKVDGFDTEGKVWIESVNTLTKRAIIRYHGLRRAVPISSVDFTRNLTTTEPRGTK